MFLQTLILRMFFHQVIYKKFASECPVLPDQAVNSTTYPEAQTAAFMLTTGGSTDAHEFTTVSEYLTTGIQNVIDNTTDLLYEVLNSTTAVTLSSSDGHVDMTPDLVHATTNIPSPMDSFLTTISADMPTPMKSVSDSTGDIHTCEAKMFTINLQVSGGPCGPFCERLYLCLYLHLGKVDLR